MASSSGLGPYCTASGLTVDILKSNGPFPTLQNISNGLVIELAQYGRVRRIKDSSIVSWVSALGFSPQNQHLSSAVWQLFEKRKELRRLRRTAQIAILESSPFDPNSWPQPESHSVTPPETTVSPQPVASDSTRDLQHDANLLTYEIAKREKTLKRLRDDVTEAQEQLNVLGRQKGHYGVRNVNKREIRFKRRNKELTFEMDKLKEENCNLRAETENWQRKVLSLQRKNRRLKKDDLPQEECASCTKLQKDVEVKNERIKFLEDQLQAVQGQEEHCLKQDGSYSLPLRLCVGELAGLEVSTANISKVIACVGKHIFNHTFSEKDLPSRSTCINIINEGGEIIKSIVAEKMESSQWGIHKDGTTRRKEHIVDVTVHFPSGEDFSLGFASVASETGVAIKENVVEKVSDLEVYSQSQTFLTDVAKTLSYFMNDRAANEKKSNELLEKWRESVLQDQAVSAPAVHSLYCMVHVLLGLHSYVLKDLEDYQKTVSDDGSGRLGRHTESAFNNFKLLQAASRVCGAASDVFAPVGDHLGLRDVWTAFCEQNGVKSTILNYKDNRFNGLFNVATAVIHHHHDFVDILKKATTEDSNKKLKGLLQDLQDNRIMTILNTLAMAYIKITGPYWNLVTTRDYVSALPSIRQLYTELKGMDTAEFLNDASPLTSLAACTDQDLLRSTFMKISDGYKDPNCARIVLNAFVRCFEKQLHDVLHTDALPENASFAPANNLNVERHFGDLDASQKRRPHASLRYHSSFVALKKHSRLISPHLQKMKTDRAPFLKHIRTVARQITQRYQKAKLHVSAQKLRKLEAKTSSKLKQKPARKVKSGPKLSDILPPSSAIIKVNMWVAVAYPDTWYPGRVDAVNDSDVKVNFGYPRKAAGDFGWPDDKDIQSITRDLILAIDISTSLKASGRYFHVNDHCKITDIYNKFRKSGGFTQ